MWQQFMQIPERPKLNWASKPSMVLKTCAEIHGTLQNIIIKSEKMRMYIN